MSMPCAYCGTSCSGGPPPRFCSGLCLARQWFDDAEELLKGCLDEPTLPAETLGRVLLLLERVKEVRYRL